MIKAKLTQVRKGGLFTFEPIENARLFFKGRRDSTKSKIWCEGIKGSILVEPNKTVYVKSIDELKTNVDVYSIEWIY